MDYVITLRYKGIWYTLLTDNKPHPFFSHHAKTYLKLGNAINMAIKLDRHYENDEVYVFQCEVGGTLGADYYNEWIKDENRIAYKISNRL